MNINKTLDLDTLRKLSKDHDVYFLDEGSYEKLKLIIDEAEICEVDISSPLYQTTNIPLNCRPERLIGFIGSRPVPDKIFDEWLKSKSYDMEIDQKILDGC